METEIQTTEAQRLILNRQRIISENQDKLASLITKSKEKVEIVILGEVEIKNAQSRRKGSYK